MLGLTSKEAEKRLKKYGFNQISNNKKKSFIIIFLKQYTDLFSILLIISALLSLVLTIFGYSDSYLDSILIFGILFFNGILSSYQEYKAEKTLEKLKEIQKTKALVYRDGKLRELDSIYLVPGDVIVLNEGDKIPADGTIIEGNLNINESTFTGESYAKIKKENDKVFSGTFVVNGYALVKITATGKNTQFGKLAEKVKNIEEISFFKSQLNNFSNKLLKYILIIIAIFFGVGFIHSHDFIQMLLAAIALGVAVVPEGLAMTSVITMMKGIDNLIQEKVLVKKLDSVETLGAVDYLISDKTGTLTEGKLKIYAIKAKGGLNKDLIYYALPNSKDDIDIAIKSYTNNKVKGELIKINPFDFHKRTSSVIYNINGKEIEFIKGAPETIFELTNEKLNIDEYLKNGLRVLAFAKRENNKISLSGVIAFEDPLRKDAKDAILKLYDAGIKLIIITGDHEITARYIGNKLNLPNIYISGNELIKMSENEIINKLKNGGVIYRALPETKMHLVTIFQNKSLTVATTGDGVNDVLLLKKSDIGIAMGSGTDVAKEAADIVLLKDSLNTIANGILYGRNIIFNVRKFIIFLLTCNVTEATSNLLFPFITKIIPLNAVKLLWINLITDGIPAISFAFDPLNKKVLKSKPYKFKTLLTKSMTKLVFISGILHGIILALFYYLLNKYFGFAVASTIIFTAIVFNEMIRIIAVKYFFDDPFFNNKITNYSMIISLLIQAIVITFIPSLFSSVALTLLQWFIVIIMMFISFIISIITIKLIKNNYI